MRKLNTQDVFKLARLIKKTNLKEDIKYLFSKSQDVDADNKDLKQKELGVEAILTVIEKAADEGVENECNSLLAGIAEKTTEEIKNMSLEGLSEILMQIAKENNVIVFFKAAYRSAAK